MWSSYIPIKENLLQEHRKYATDNIGDDYLFGMYVIPQLIYYDEEKENIGWR